LGYAARVRYADKHGPPPREERSIVPSSLLVAAGGVLVLIAVVALAAFALGAILLARLERMQERHPWEQPPTPICAICQRPLLPAHERDGPKPGDVHETCHEGKPKTVPAAT
jgi:hypothetical protein